MQPDNLSKTPLPEDRREFRRAAIDGWVAKVSAEGSSVTGKIVDIGANGISLDCHSLGDDNTPCWVKMSRGNNLVIEIVGRIVRVTDKGVAIQFTDISPEDFRSLQQIVHRAAAQSASIEP